MRHVLTSLLSAAALAAVTACGAPAPPSPAAPVRVPGTAVAPSTSTSTPLPSTAAATPSAGATPSAAADNASPTGTPALSAIGVRDRVPDGAPAQAAPFPALRRAFDATCGGTAPSPPRPPANLVRWMPDPDKGLPEQGYDVYRCCGPNVAPPSGDPSWVKLNTSRVRPPKTQAEGLAFVTGAGTFPDGRTMVGARLLAEEWQGLCHLLFDALGAPTDCAALPAPGAGTTTNGGAPLAITPPDSTSLLLALSTRPEVATALGLYWVDDSSTAAEGCFYRVEAHWDAGAEDAVVGPLREARLDPPTGVTATALPAPGAGTCAGLGGPSKQHVGPRTPAVALTWDLPGPFERFGPFGYNVCRKAPGEAAATQINHEAQPTSAGTVTAEVPVLVARVPEVDDQGTPQTHADGSTRFKLPARFYTDDLRANPRYDQVYAYRVTSLDLFGRESGPSAPATATPTDVFGPPAPVGLSATTRPLSPVGGTPRAEVTLTWDWTALERKGAPDAAAFAVYRRWDVPTLEEDPTVAGCLLGPQASSAWTKVGADVAIGAPAARYTAKAQLPPDDVERLGDSVPVDRFVLKDTLELTGTSEPVRHAYYRVVALDARGNPSGPSGPARGHVVDTRPATPPSEVAQLFSRSEWDGGVHVHLVWKAGAGGATPMGYKLLRSVSRPACDPGGPKHSQCPARCDRFGACTPTTCMPDGVCGGSDAGPSGARQQDREMMLTDGVVPLHGGTQIPTFGKLQSLAALGNLWKRGPSGEPVAVGPSCALPSPNQAQCVSELQAALGAGVTQYAQDTLPASAAGQTYFYRVMAVSEAGIQETGDPAANTFGGPFIVRLPDFVAPPRPAIASVLAKPDDDAVEVRWQAQAPRDTKTGAAGWTLYRADVGGALGAPQALPKTATSYLLGGALDAGRCYRVEVRPANAAGEPLTALSPVATGVVSGSAPAPLMWTAQALANLPAEATQLAVRTTSAPWVARHGAPVRPASAPATFQDAVHGPLTVTTEHYGKALPELVARDRPPVAGRAYCYALRLVDAAGNASAWSTPLVGRRVDTAPPAAPAGLAVTRVGGEGHVRWHHAEAGLRATVQRSRAGAAGPWRTLVDGLSGTPVASAAAFSPWPVVFDTWATGPPGSANHHYRFRDVTAALGVAYHYRVQLIDASGNRSSVTAAGSVASLGATP